MLKDNPKHIKKAHFFLFFTLVILFMFQQTNKEKYELLFRFVLFCSSHHSPQKSILCFHYHCYYQNLLLLFKKRITPPRTTSTFWCTREKGKTSHLALHYQRQPSMKHFLVETLWITTTAGDNNNMQFCSSNFSGYKLSALRLKEEKLITFQYKLADQK